MTNKYKQINREVHNYKELATTTATGKSILSLAGHLKMLQKKLRARRTKFLPVFADNATYPSC